MTFRCRLLLRLNLLLLRWKARQVKSICDGLERVVAQHELALALRRGQPSPDGSAGGERGNRDRARTKPFLDLAEGSRLLKVRVRLKKKHPWGSAHDLTALENWAYNF
jgi:hypothetical protein